VSREVCTAKREVTTTPLQSLVLLNDPQFVEAARRVAENALRQLPTDPGGRNSTVFRALLGRAPDDVESKILSRMFDEQRVLFKSRPDDAASLLGVGEAKADQALDRVDLAALTTVASAVMNFDEFVVVR
jgi:hypothetical protein